MNDDFHAGHLHDFFGSMTITQEVNLLVFRTEQWERAGGGLNEKSGDQDVKFGQDSWSACHRADGLQGAAGKHHAR